MYIQRRISRPPSIEYVSYGLSNAVSGPASGSLNINVSGLWPFTWWLWRFCFRLWLCLWQRFRFGSRYRVRQTAEAILSHGLPLGRV